MSTVRELRELVYEIQKPDRMEGRIFYDKIQFKNFLNKHNIRTPTTFIHILEESQIEQIHPLSRFIMKPNRGSQGIDVYNLEFKDGLYHEISGRTHTWEFIQGKARNILRMRFSGGVVIEEVIENPENFKVFNKGKGIIDFRIYMLDDKILFGKFRVPTLRSEGYANTGRKATAMFVDNKGIIREDDIFNNTSAVHPDTKINYNGQILPYWKEFESTAVRIAELFKLKFHSVDLTIDSNGKACCIESEMIPLLSHFTSKGCDVMIKNIKLCL